ncbi:hypothetical protein [Flavobacterium sp. N3904]|uniref:hypothetical protein n=1 Tax=Flavobacterium sp. N3904 TaxID=2986835 RepID=UPI002224A0AF|nr:hypothetical protein [Flavobacterium sp. N3904]
MNRVNTISSTVIGFVLIFQVLTSCNSKNVDEDNNLTLSFEYVPEGGQGILQSNDMNEKIIKTKKNQDNIEISVYKWIGLPIDTYNGKCELKSDTLYLYYWREIKESYKDSAQVALTLESQLKYKIRKVKYRRIVVELKDNKYIK